MADVAGLAGMGEVSTLGASKQSFDAESAGAKFCTTAFPILCGLGTLNAYLLKHMWDRLQDPTGMFPVLEAIHSVSMRVPYEVPCFVAACLALIASCICCLVIILQFFSGDILVQKKASPLEEYTLSEKMGEGAFGAVYRATKVVPGHTGLAQKDFALKIIPVHRIKEANCGIAEAMRLARVDHRCVVGVHEHFFDLHTISLKERLLQTGSPLRLCIAQELCSGDLQFEIQGWEKVAKGEAPPDAFGRPEWEQLLRIFREIVEGVEALHSKGIIHRDLKPANIFISADHKHVQVGDLGIAENVERRQLDIQGLGRAGTPGYMAPEVAADKAYSTRADNWSLGCLLVDMAYPTELGGWSVQTIMEQNGFTEVKADNVHLVVNHPSLADNAFAKRMVERSLIEDPHHRWGCQDLLDLWGKMPRAQSKYIFSMNDGTPREGGDSE